MATTVSFNGSNFSIPANREPKGWGSSLTSFLLEVAEAAMTPAGGNYGLQADLNLGADSSAYGLVAKYYKSVSSNIAQSGVVRLANNESIAWRNAANSADLTLKVDTSNRLAYGSFTVDGSSNVICGSVDYSGTITGSALTASRVLQTNGSKGIESSTITSTELGHLSGVSSNIQSQIGNKITGPGSATDNRVLRMDGTSGRLAQESNVAIDDSGNMTGVGTITSTALTANRALIANANKDITHSSVTSTELGYLSGVTSPTGSGALVLATSPALTTPNIGTPSAGTLTNCTGLPAGSIVPKTDGAAVATTKIGERLTGTFLTPSYVSNTAANIMSLTLTAGVWMVYGKAQTGTAGSTYTRFECSLSTTSATLNAKSTAHDNYGSNDKDRNVTPGPIYVNTTGTTVYLVGLLIFTGAAPVSSSGFNELFAVRVG